MRREAIVLGWMFLLSACTAFPENAALEEAISAQGTSVAHLATQVAEQEQTDLSQWEALSHLATQMPLALGRITPIPAGESITATPSPSIDIEYPPYMRTGIQEIDHVIDVMMQRDVEARLGLVRLTTTACTTQDGLGGPPKCEAGEPQGTMVDAFPMSNGEGHFIRADKLREALDFTVRGLLAVYIVPDDAYATAYWPAGEHGIVFTSEDGGYPHVITLLVERGSVVRLDFDPGWPPLELVWAKSDEFILAPMR